MAGDLPYLHPELLVQQVLLQLVLDHDTLAAGGDLDGDVDRGGEGGKLQEVIQQPSEAVLRNHLLVPEINIPGDIT